MLLAIDTSGPLCSVALLDLETDKFVFSKSDDLGRGHAEHLMTMLENEMASSAVEWGEITRVAVVVGPGSFTGLRVGIAAARGFALALNVPCTGVSVFDAIRFEHRAVANLACMLDARRDQVWMQCYDKATSISGPATYSAEDFTNFIDSNIDHVAGSAVALLGENGRQRFTIVSKEASPSIEAVARFAADRFVSDEEVKPLYLRDPDAKPQKVGA